MRECVNEMVSGEMSEWGYNNWELKILNAEVQTRIIKL